MENGVTSNGGGGSPNPGPLRRLACSVKNYDWGRTGSASLVAGLHTANSGSRLDPDLPYAELWMGTHESGPSYVVQGSGDQNGATLGSEGATLKSWIKGNPDVLGDRVLDKWGCDLPFLFKVLSVAKALSIQAHPNKALAEALHKLHPDLYKDDNHKPEMALAITNFEALCGFVTLEELKAVVVGVPEIKDLVGAANAERLIGLTEQDEDEKVKSVLQSIFTALMSTSPSKTAEAISKMKSRLLMESQERQLSEKEQLILRLESQYPGDVGVISAFFFNHVKLHAGEALYLGANELHAYLSGECVECMATSDNVVRAGLTPKHRDVQTLCRMLTYQRGFPKILKGFSLSPYITRYLPPFYEFEVDVCALPPGASTVFPSVPGPSIFLVTEGTGRLITDSQNEGAASGDVIFASANTKIDITNESRENDMKVYRAGVSSRFFQLV